MTFGEKLQKLRKARQLTQEELAGQIGVSRQALSKWESDAVLPDTENVIKLCDLFGVSTDYLLRNGPAKVSPEERPTAQASPEEAPGQGRKGLGGIVLGSIMSTVSLLGMVILGIISSVGDYEILYPTSPGEDGVEVACAVGKSGLFAFLEIKHLEWLFGLLLAGALVGGVILWSAWKDRKTE